MHYCRISCLLLLLLSGGACFTSKLEDADMAREANDMETACALYLELAEEGDIRSQTYTGSCYMHGLGGFHENRLQAIQWWRKASEKGEPIARAFLIQQGITPPAGVNSEKEK